MAEPTVVAARVVGILGKLDRLSASVDKRFEAVLKEIAAEGEKTRRHLEMVAEQMKSERELPIDEATPSSEKPYS